MMDSTFKQEVIPVDNSDHGEMLQWINNNDDLTPAEKELYREIDATH